MKYEYQCQYQVLDKSGRFRQCKRNSTVHLFCSVGERHFCKQHEPKHLKAKAGKKGG